jgi:hypothetical protein
MSQALSMTPRAGDPQLLGPFPVPEVQTQLQAVARTAEPGRAEALLREALELDPYCLDTYMGFCRLFVRQGRLKDAENAALATLCVAAHAGGFDPDWRNQQPHGFYWKRPGPAERYYLAALEVLAAVRLMQTRVEEQAAILQKLQELGVTTDRNRVMGSRQAA